MGSQLSDCYSKTPLSVIEGIPVFSETDFYIENYQKISEDHVSAISEQSENPWISEQKWSEMEAGTLMLVKKYIGSNECNYLDVGVGLGRLASKVKNIATSGVNYYGMDISLQYLIHAKNKHINVCLSKIEDMPYKDDSFDIITCTDVLEHVLDLNFCVSQILRVLKPGGILIIRVPNREDLSPYLDPDYPYEMAHLRTFDEYSLELLFTRIFGLEFVEKSPGLLVENSPLLKYKLPVKGCKFLLRLLLTMVKKVSLTVYRNLLAVFYYPTEINIVVRKPTN